MSPGQSGKVVRKHEREERQQQKGYERESG
jgi:hypothetical protein